MPRKRSSILQKVSHLLKLSIFIARMRKSTVSRLSLMNSSRLKKFKLQKHYKYGYIQAYQFSPSNTPLIHYPSKKVKKRSHTDTCSVFLLCRCFGDFPLELEGFPSIEAAGAVNDLSEFWDSSGEDDSVDERAERFIERFYAEMRMQRRESLGQLNGMLDMLLDLKIET
ncbi:hypothetical protein RJ640_026673 [Escallonia rubra]|uniref:Cotton fiber protein n=1 Tax=Escallonia rubra TaxID=112253 RepID=A0AA88S4C6_9ASTE|nr:hypothetical protein RJ640_026673 [Escallonia rubra]